MTARDDILGGIRRALRRGAMRREAVGELAARVAAHRRNLIPARAAALDAPGRVELFVAMAEAVQTTVARVASDGDVPGEVARYLAAENLPAELAMAPDPALDALPWDERPLLQIRRGKAEAGRRGVADAVPRGGRRDRHVDAGFRRRHADDAQFPPRHAYRRAARRPGRRELRGRLGLVRARAPGALPRTVNFITGPSRTGDIEQRIELGAHGPRRLHVILVGDAGQALRPGQRALAPGDARREAAAPQPRARAARSRRRRPGQRRRERAIAPARSAAACQPPLDRFAGIDRANAERLKRGKHPIEARIDLHGMTQEEAHRALAAFIRAAHAQASAVCWSSPGAASWAAGCCGRRCRAGWKSRNSGRICWRSPALSRGMAARGRFTLCCAARGPAEPAGDGDFMARNGELTLDIDLLRAARVLCIGDVMLDHYVYGEVDRLSPEAPVPVLAVDSESYSLGGAGNVLRNLAALGAQVSFVSVVGNDDAGREVQNLLAALDGAEIHVLMQPQRKTTVKTRFIAVNQHLLRADRESAAPLGPYIRDDLLRLVRELVTNHDVVVISDYAKGVLTDGVALEIIKAAQEAGAKTVVEPKGGDHIRYRGADLLIPTRRELSEATGLPAANAREVAVASRALIERCGFGAVLVMLGRDGMILVEPRAAPRSTRRRPAIPTIRAARRTRPSHPSRPRSGRG